MDMNYHELFHRIKHNDSSSFLNLSSELANFLSETINSTYIEGYDEEDLLQLCYMAMYLSILNYNHQQTMNPLDYLKEAVLNSLNLEIEKRVRQGYFLSVENLCPKYYRLIEKNSYNEYLAEKHLDSKGDVNFMIDDKFYFNNVQEFFCVCNKLMDDLNIQKQFVVSLSDPESDNFKKKLKNASRVQVDDMYEFVMDFLLRTGLVQVL